MFLNIIRLSFTAVLDKLILSILKLLFVEPVLLNRITKLWNFVFPPKFPSSLSSTQPFKQFVYKTMFTTLVIRELKQLRRRPQRRLQKTIGLMIKTTAQHVHHAF